MARARLGEHAAAWKLLLPYLERVAEKDRPPLLATLSRTAMALGHQRQAIELLGRLHVDSDRAVEKLYARHHLETLIGSALSAADLRAVYAAADSGSLVAALAGRRLAELHRSRGELEAARELLDDTESARTEHGVSAGAVTGLTAGGRAVGLLVPLSGPYTAAGERLLSGATVGSGSFQSGVKPVQLLIRDSSGGAEQAARDLVERGVVALAGTLDATNAAAVSRVASAAGVPFLSTSPKATRAGGDAGTLALFPDNLDRARQLARHAAGQLEARRAAILRPSTGYGKAMADAFSRELTQLGGRIVTEVTYPSGTTSFAKLATQIAGHRFDALFIPDAAVRLALVAPALARAGLWSSAPSSADLPSRDDGRAYHLLSTADGLHSDVLRRAGRYLQGAVLAPGFFPDPAAAESGDLVRQYVQSTGSPPGLLEAFGHDALLAVRSLLDRGATGRAALGASLRGGSRIQGLTGTIQFSRSGSRGDSPLLYRVAGDAVKLISSAAATASSPTGKL
jgi:ABC-type branched-subunit amino acid transport system substrate-binding protein